jgi:hypothetical protein
MELGWVTLKRIGFFCFPIKHSTHTSFCFPIKHSTHNVRETETFVPLESLARASAADRRTRAAGMDTEESRACKGLGVLKNKHSTHTHVRGSMPGNNSGRSRFGQ